MGGGLYKQGAVNWSNFIPISVHIKSPIETAADDFHSFNAYDLLSDIMKNLGELKMHKLCIRCIY